MTDSLVEVWIVQPYVPAYRVAFFTRLRERMLDDGVRLRIVAGVPEKEQAARGDQAQMDWVVPARSRSVRVGRRALSLTVTRRHWRSAEGVIVPLQGTSLDAHLALVRTRRRVGLWGHVASYVSPSNAIDEQLERCQVHRADHVFAYTPGGAREAVRWGAHPANVTTVMNAVPTDELESALSQVRASRERELSLPHAPVLAFIGGLDESKRVTFLAGALKILRERGVRVHVAVAGGGTQVDALSEAVDHGQVTLLGYLDAPRKAELLEECVGIVSPGRIGLLAVDALVAGKPILTTNWPFHAPEAEYLVEGTSRLTADDDLHSFADLVESYLSDGHFQTRQWSYPTLDGMVQNFADGIVSMLNGPDRPPGHASS